MQGLEYTNLPENIKQVLGTSTKEIVNTIILDIINNSIDKDYILLSEEVYKAIVELKKFNYERIYSNAYTEEERKEYTQMFKVLFKKYLSDVKNNNAKSPIYYSYLNNMCDEYKKDNTTARIVIDYIAGMSDDFFIKQYNDIIKGVY